MIAHISCDGSTWLLNLNNPPAFDRNRGLGVLLTSMETWRSTRVWVTEVRLDHIARELERTQGKSQIARFRHSSATTGILRRDALAISTSTLEE